MFHNTSVYMSYNVNRK